MSRTKRCHELRRERIDINLEPYGESGSRADAGTYAAVIHAFDRLIEPERSSPPGFISKRVVAECFLALDQHLVCMIFRGLSRCSIGFTCSAALRVSCDGSDEAEGDGGQTQVFERVHINPQSLRPGEVVGQAAQAAVLLSK